jgi:hypothetical protein
LARISAFVFALFAAAPALAGGPDLTARFVQGQVEVRISAGGRVTDTSGRISVQLGPTFPPCGIGALDSEQASFFVFEPGGSFDVGGFAAWTGRSGRARLLPGAEAFADEVRDAYLLRCEENRTPEACAELLARLELRLRRAQLDVSARRVGEAAARLRGRAELVLLDPQREEPPFVFRLTLRERVPLTVEGPYFGSAFCGIVVPLGGSLTLVAPGSR